MIRGQILLFVVKSEILWITTEHSTVGAPCSSLRGCEFVWKKLEILGSGDRLGNDETGQGFLSCAVLII